MSNTKKLFKVTVEIDYGVQKDLEIFKVVAENEDGVPDEIRWRLDGTDMSKWQIAEIKEITKKDQDDGE
ncbi:MAG: hypothetical protein MJZ25_15600 [Fibrobacter sp.]|nr:hypothetical protein [Fibrobacter sp.]